jgi:nucleotide-binding universal stress UspA family protein
MKISRILIPTDFSPDADEAFAYAVDLARTVGASIELLHVVEDPMAAGVWSAPMYKDAIEGLHVNLVREARRRLRLLVPGVGGARLAVDRQVLVGKPEVEIVKRAAEAQADLIVMGTGGRSGVARLVMGSVAERVVRTAGCAVLTVKSESGKKRQRVS